MAKNKQKKRLQWMADWSRRKKIIVGSVVAGVFLFVAMSLGAYIFINQKAHVETEESGDNSARRWEEYKKQREQESAVMTDAQEALARGETDKVDSIYEDAVKAEADTVRKIKLMIDQSKLLYGSGKQDEAIRVAKSAESLSEDKYIVAVWLARVYENRKEYKQAAEYYTLAGEWAQSTTNVSKLDKVYYDSQAVRVSALAGSHE